MNPQQIAQMQAQAMAARGGGMTPQQQQMMMMQQQQAYGGMPAGAAYGGMPAGAAYGGMPAGAAYGGMPAGAAYGGMPAGAAYGGMPAGGAYPAAAAYPAPPAAAYPQAQPVPATASPAPPPAPMPAPAPGPATPAAAIGTTISVGFSDGTLVGYDRLRRQFILTGKFNGHLSTMTIRVMPARPLWVTEAVTEVVNGRGEKVVVDKPKEPVVPVEKEGFMTKLGWKKGMFGSESWKERNFKLNPTTLEYFKDGGERHTIKLTTACKVRVVNSSEPARKDRFHDNDNSMLGMMTNPIGSVLVQTSGPIGKDNCVELIVPVQIGNMLNGIMGQNALQLGMGGGQRTVDSNRARTYYFFGSSREEAQSWCDAIENNISAMTANQSDVGGSFGYIDAIKDQAMNLQSGMKDASDPSKSLLWFQKTLGTAAPLAELFQGLNQMFDQLDAVGVPHN